MSNQSLQSSRSPLLSARGRCLAAMVVLLWSGCGGTASRRLGEVYMYKATPREAVITSDRSRTVYTLRGPGYPANENANRIFDAFSSFGHVGPLMLIEEASRLAEEADREFQIRSQQGEANSPTAKALSSVAREAWQIYATLNDRYYQVEADDEKSRIDSKRLKRREQQLIASVQALFDTQRYLITLQEDLKDLYSDLYRNNRWVPWTQRKEYLGNKYPFFIALGGQPLPNKTWTYLSHPGPVWDKEKNSQVPTYIIDQHFAEYLVQAIPLAATDEPDKQHLQVQLINLYRQLGKDLRDIAEQTLNLQGGLQNQWERLPRISYVKIDGYQRIEHERLSIRIPISSLIDHSMTNGSSEKHDEDKSTEAGEEVVIGATPAEEAALHAPVDAMSDDRREVVETTPYKRMINSIQTAARNSVYLVQEILERHAAEMRVISRPYVAEKVRIEALARRFDDLVPRHPNRRIRVVDDPSQPPTRLTIFLKTLFIKYLTEGSSSTPPEARGAELLVTCEVESAQDVSADQGEVTPIVYEPHYAPGHFVNVRDRIVYGPRTYQGEFFNVKLSVVELDGLQNSAISSGLDLAIDSIGNAQPELAAISPFVSTFFRGVLNALGEDDVEMKFEFTIPGPEGKGKADVDLLIAETGHYILLKRENIERGEYNQELAQRRYTNNDLIYNPEDGHLYYRRDMENPQNNFQPTNLFREQTYMVLVVTDEYTREDNLGQALRQRLSQSLGEDRSQKLIPDVATARTMLDDYDRLQQSFVIEDGAPLDAEGRRMRLKQVNEQQDQLWSSGSDLSKTLLVRGLNELATDRTRERLGQDIDAWKRATLTVRDDGRVDIDE